MGEKKSTLDKGIEAIEQKLEEQIPIFAQMPLAQTQTSTQGEKVLKANPAFDAFLNLAKSYATMLRARRGLDDESAETTSTLEDIRSKFKIAL